MAARQDTKRHIHKALLCAAVVVLFVFATAIAWQFYVIRSTVKWFAHSRRYKAEVLAQPPLTGQLKHIEWDGWGGTPVGDWTVYVVFDPTDSLSAAASRGSSGRFNGIPCNVDEVRRLENDWYSVTLAMNEWWEQCK